MEWMRLTLVIAGIVLVAAIYLWERYKQRRRDADQRWHDIELGSDEEVEVAEEEVIPESLRTTTEDPLSEGWSGTALKAERRSHLGDEVLAGLKGISSTAEEEELPEFHATVETEDKSETAPQTQAPPRDEAVIVLALMAREEAPFHGMKILDAMEICGLSFGRMGIFHYPDTDSGETLFSVANVLEPGSFDRERMDELETPGLALFMPLPAPIDGEKALLTFVQQARRLREQLDGRLTDGRRRELSRETIDELKQTARRFRVTAE